MIDRIMKPINKLYNKWVLAKQHVAYDNTLQVRGRLYVFGNLRIGKNVAINSGFKFNPIGGQERTIFYTRGNGKITIGNHVGISNSAFFSCAEIQIEDYVKIGGSCKFYDNDFHSLNYEQRISAYDTDIKAAPIVIKEGAFIGAHSIILKGVTVGRHSIVGAGAVVTKDIPDGEIWAGNPAKFIRKIENG